MNKFSKSLKGRSIIYLVLAVLLAFLFFLSLHPVSGFIGGIFYYFFEWLIPSAVNILLSIWLTKVFVKKSEKQKIAFFIFSIVLGLNTNLFVPFMQFSSPKITKSIAKVIHPQKGISITIKDEELYRDLLFPKNPYIAPVTTAGDEGCMCLYFKIAERTLQETIQQADLLKTTPENADANLVMDIKEHNSNAQVTVELFQNNELLSSFQMTDIPVVNLKGRHGREKKLLNGYFYINTIQILVHNNLWSYLAGYMYKLISGDNLNNIEFFLNAALDKGLKNKS